MNIFYENLHLKFDLSGQTVEGILNGSCKIWDFKSQSHAFLKLIPSGHLAKYAVFSEVTPDLRDLYDSIQKCVELLGYSFICPEEE